MLAHPTIDQLNALGLCGLAKGFKELEHKPEARVLDHAEWLGLLLEYELTLRRQKQFETGARAAKLRHPASVEDINYHESRGLDRALFLKLTGLRLDRRAMQFARNGRERPRQELARLRARPQGLSRQHLRSLHLHGPAVRRSRHRALRRPLRQAVTIYRPRQTAHPGCTSTSARVSACGTE